MAGMEQAVQRLSTAIALQEPILLYGDYDVDGTVSIVVLKKAIEILGGTVDFHVPHRLNEGYGMRADIVERAAMAGVRLIVSVDTGIRAAEVVRQANTLGVDVIVTDHHLPDETLPPALAVLNPNRTDCGYPEKGLCGAGVTFKLIQALLQRSTLPKPKQLALLESFLKPVSIATVADIVPLTGENRTIVKHGLSGLQQVRNPGLRALMEVAGFTAGEAPSAHQVAFRLAPRINAAGRMASASDVIELFSTADAARARELAEQLDLLNRERQGVEAQIVDTIIAECEQLPIAQDHGALVFARAGWHAGVLGIVASRLVERFCRPVFVLTDVQSEAGSFAGSGRSIPAFHLLEALEQMPELFTKFGGHRQAAGLTLRPGNLELFRNRLRSVASQRLCSDDFCPQFKVDAQLNFDELTDHCVEQLFALGPFGFGNLTPTLMVCGAEVSGPVKVITEGKHFKVPLRHHGRLLFVNAWNFGDRRDLFTTGSHLDLLLQVEDDQYGRRNGFGSWCISLKDARASQT